jgi:para-aminobenzoate synthetase
MISPYPTPPISPSGSSTNIPQFSNSSSEASSSTSRNADKARESSLGRLKLVEKRFGITGREAKTADVFQAVMASRKGKERAIGEVWLDGETVSLSHHIT